MTLDELKHQCQRVVANGLNRVTLVVTRNQPPTHENIRVKGLGKGYVCNCVEHSNGTYSIVAQFDADHILKTIEKQEAIAANPSPKDNTGMRGE